MTTVARNVAAFRQQVGALVLRRTAQGVHEVLLLTSRESGRWVIAKGWPMKGRKEHAAAAQEALEEGGIIGKFSKRPLGVYTYFKRQDEHFDTCLVKVFRMKYTRQTELWKEKDQRDLRWFSLEDAADIVQEPGLSALLRSLGAAGKRRHKEKPIVN